VTGFQAFFGSAIYVKLIAIPGTVHWGTRVFDTLGPEGVGLPYVVFQHTAGGSDNITPNQTYDVEVRIECIGATKTDARIGAAYIESGFGSVTDAVSVPGYKNFMTFEQDFFNRVDNIGGTQYWRQGSIYRLRFDAT
jgi:hypothetical protein